MSEMFRSLAGDLRKEAVRRDGIRRDKAAAILVASTGLGLLRTKIGAVK